MTKIEMLVKIGEEAIKYLFSALLNSFNFIETG